MLLDSFKYLFFLLSFFTVKENIHTQHKNVAKNYQGWGRGEAGSQNLVQNYEAKLLKMSRGIGFPHNMGNF